MTSKEGILNDVPDAVFHAMTMNWNRIQKHHVTTVTSKFSEVMLFNDSHLISALINDTSENYYFESDHLNELLFTTIQTFAELIKELII